jgi:hypothetical protein
MNINGWLKILNSKMAKRIYNRWIRQKTDEKMEYLNAMTQQRYEWSKHNS